MKTIFEKACAGEYFEKFNKQGNRLRSAEQFPSGNWVVWTWAGKDISGEYTEEEFKEIKKYFK